jgi:hypothetical protein
MNRCQVARGLAVALVCLAGARDAGADDPVPEPFKVTVSYQAPAACPGVSTFMTLLAAHLRAGDNAPLYTQIKIADEGPRYQLELTVYVAATPHRSEETAASCDELVRLAALMTAVARTQAPPLIPPAELTAFTPHEAPEAPVVPPPRVFDRPPPPVPEAPAPPTGPHWLLGAQVQGASGVLPGVAFGTGPLLELAWENIALRASASFWLPSEVPPPEELASTSPLSLRLQSLDLAPCLRRAMYAGSANELALSACAVLSGYRLTSVAPQLDVSRDVVYRAGAGFSAGVTWLHASGLSVGAELGLSDLFEPFRVHAAPSKGLMYESRANQAHLNVVVGFRFGGAGEG